MAQLTPFGFMKHLRAEPSSHVLVYRNGELRQSGRGLTAWLLPLSSAVAEIPADDRDLSFLFHERTADYQDVTVQGVISYRVTDAEKLAGRVDFTVDMRTGRHAHEPLEQVALLVTQLAQQLARPYLIATSIRNVLKEGAEKLRAVLSEGLESDDKLGDMGLDILHVRVASVQPTAELEKALETPTREAVQQDADEATFQRRALAVEKERAIAENELQNRIELARREEQLIAEQGRNERKRAEETAEAARIENEAEAERMRVEAEAQAESIRLVETANVEAERAKLEAHASVGPPTLTALAALELAGNLQRIENLSLAPDVLGPVLTRLVNAGTRKLETGPDDDLESEREEEWDGEDAQ